MLDRNKRRSRVWRSCSWRHNSSRVSGSVCQQ